MVIKSPTVIWLLLTWDDNRSVENSSGITVSSSRRRVRGLTWVQTVTSHNQESLSHLTTSELRLEHRDEVVDRLGPVIWHWVDHKAGDGHADSGQYYFRALVGQGGDIANHSLLHKNTWYDVRSSNSLFLSSSYLSLDNSVQHLDTFVKRIKCACHKQLLAVWLTFTARQEAPKNWTSWGLSEAISCQQNDQAWGDNWARVSHLCVSWEFKTYQVYRQRWSGSLPGWRHSCRIGVQRLQHFQLSAQCPQALLSFAVAVAVLDVLSYFLVIFSSAMCLKTSEPDLSFGYTQTRVTFLCGLNFEQSLIFACQRQS